MMLYTHEENYLESIICIAHWEHDSSHYTCLILQEIPWANHDCHILLVPSCGRDHLENLQRHFMADFLDGVAWAILFQPKDRGSPMDTSNGERIILRSTSTLSIQPQHIAETRGWDFHWMIAWMRGSSLGAALSHAYHHSYLKEATFQQEGFHYTFYLSMRSIIFNLHTWERALEGRFVADIWAVVGPWMRRPQEKKEE